jgi:hypothetical protein
MLELKKLSNRDLELQLKTISQKERELLCESLELIKEIFRRRLYLEKGYPSLFEYLVKEIGYSQGSAQRRIDAAKVLAEVPEIKSKLESGEINLTHMTLLEKASRELKLENKEKVSPKTKKEILEALINTNKFEAEKIIAASLNLPVKEETKIKPQANNTVWLGMALPIEVYEKLKEAKMLFSHQVPSGDLVKLLDLVLDKVLEKETKAPAKQKSAAKTQTKQNDDANLNVAKEDVHSTNSTATVAVTGNKTLTPKTKKEVRKRDEGCQYRDPITGRQCESKWQTEVDHIQSQWAEGKHSLENLQLLCKQHNAFKYRKEAGLKYQ